MPAPGPAARPALLLALLALALPAVLPGAPPAAALTPPPGPCPGAPPLGLLQDDAGSGRDAGLHGDEVAIPGDGHFWGTLDPPLQTGMQDQYDGYVAAIPPGPREVTVEVKSLGKVLDPKSSWPFVYWLEVFRAGIPVAFRGSWEDPIAFASPGGEVLHVEVYIVPLYWHEACAASGPPGPSAAAVPAEPQLYRVLFACAPACFG